LMRTYGANSKGSLNSLGPVTLSCIVVSIGASGRQCFHKTRDTVLRKLASRSS
jgi:hypothetical protein